MIQSQRVKHLNSNKMMEGSYVLYWMQASHRCEYNYALEYSIQIGNSFNLPVVVIFILMDNFPEANSRHFYFMLEGLIETQKALARRNIKMVIIHNEVVNSICEFSKDTVCIVTDVGYTRFEREIKKSVAEKVKCPLIAVESNIVVPVEETSLKEEFGAYTLRPKIYKKLYNYLIPLKEEVVNKSSLYLDMESTNIENIDEIIENLNIDKSVNRVNEFKGGTSEAKKLLDKFINYKLEKYSDYRNIPGGDFTSDLSPYLHFGQISPVYIALKISNFSCKSKDEYLEELIVRRELAINYVYYNKNYDKSLSDILPSWAFHTLKEHSKDNRKYNYSIEILENAMTHDIYWNTAQREMLQRGKMQGYMRMYWGKKIIEWTQNPEEAFKIALYLNNKYNLDGRDPNGFAGVAWCFGKHDRAWAERPIFGKVRYMNDIGLKRKFNMDKYINQIQIKHNRTC